MALKVKNDEGDESSEDENSKLKSYITKQFKKSIRKRMLMQVTMTVNNLDFLNLSVKRDSRENPKRLDKIATLWLVQSVMGVKDTDTRNLKN